MSRGTSRPTIGTVVICPPAPFLLRRYTGRVPVGTEVRTACLEVLRPAVRDVDRVVVLTGVTEGGANRLPPVGFRVAGELLAAVGYTGPVRELPIATDADPAECAWLGSGLGADDDADAAGPGRRTLLLVMADGSARRGEKAPGHLDERAAALDEGFARAVAAADTAALAAMDPELARDLLFDGRAALQVLAAVPGLGTCRSRVAYQGGPFGVFYVVAEWSCDR
jgi:hypothetical protein